MPNVDYNEILSQVDQVSLIEIVDGLVVHFREAFMPFAMQVIVMHQDVLKIIRNLIKVHYLRVD